MRNLTILGSHGSFEVDPDSGYTVVAGHDTHEDSDGVYTIYDDLRIYAAIPACPTSTDNVDIIHTLLLYRCQRVGSADVEILAGDLTNSMFHNGLLNTYIQLWLDNYDGVSRILQLNLGEGAFLNCIHRSEYFNKVLTRMEEDWDTAERGNFRDYLSRVMDAEANWYTLENAASVASLLSEAEATWQKENLLAS